MNWYKSLVINSIVLGLSILVGVTIVDQSMHLFDFPDAFREQVSHPINATERRRNYEFDYTFKTNEFGLRNPPFPLEKPDGRYRILVVGDSFVEGMGVEQEDAFTSVLNEQYQSSTPTVRFINAGFSGQGPTEYQSIIESFAGKLDVDLVLICLYANDLRDTKLPKPRSVSTQALSTVWPRLTTQLQHLVRKHRRRESVDANTADDDFLDKVIDEARRKGIADEKIEQWAQQIPPELLDAANNGELNGPLLSFGLTNPDYWRDSIEVDSDDARRQWSVMRDTLTDTTTDLAETGIASGIVYIPSVFQYDPESFESGKPWPTLGSHLNEDWLTEKTGIVQRLEALAKARAIPFLDLTEYFREQIRVDEAAMNYRFDEHLTPHGHELVGEWIADWIERQNLIENRS